MQNMKTKFLLVIEWAIAISAVILVLLVIYPSINPSEVAGVMLIYTGIMMVCLYLIFFVAKGRMKIKLFGWMGLVLMILINVI